MTILFLPAASVKFSIGRERYGLRAPKGGCTVGGRVFRGGQFCLPYDPTSPHGEPARSDLDPSRFAPIKLAINGFTYAAREVPAGECGSVAFELRKVETNHTYHVIRDGFGEVSCSCPDYELRRAGTGVPCKHGRGLVALGLVAPPTSAAAPVEAHALRRRRFEPSPQEMAEAAQLFGDVQADRIAYHHELAAAL